MSEQNQNSESMIGGHVKYAKGVGESAVGAVTGSEAWKSSAEQDKQAGIDEMKAANTNRDPQQNGYGKAEEMAGKAFGCEGMEEEGAQSKTQ